MKRIYIQPSSFQLQEVPEFIETSPHSIKPYEPDYNYSN